MNTRLTVANHSDIIYTVYHISELWNLHCSLLDTTDNNNKLAATLTFSYKPLYVDL